MVQKTMGLITCGKERKMKNAFVLGLILMVGILVANDNSSAPDGFVPSVVNSSGSSMPVESFTSVDNSMGANNSEDCAILPVSTGTDAFTFTTVNWSHFSWFGSYCRGLDVVSHSSVEMLMSPAISSDSIYFINFNDGTMNDKVPLDPANTGGWGCYPYGSINVNDYMNNHIYNSTNLGVSWTAYTNPSASYGRGMDVDYSTDLVWETYSSTGVYSFSHLASTGTFYDISAYIPEMMSGLTVYENGGYHLLFINTYNTGYAYIFDLDDNLNYLGAVAYPYQSTTDHSYGLAYSNTRDTFFWAYKDTNTSCFLVEVELGLTGLEQSTWADIKSSF
ncbi:MAG: hypothetical protein K8S24_06875 [Candidatus Aegiribacteria sp.]|nr:hypothetical protein [Candidatus Aegiribacteria sp.]